MSRFFSKKYSSLEAYVPGEQPKERKYIKLNTNESPYPPSKEVIEAAEREAGRLQLFSDPECTPLVSACAELHSVSPDEVIMVNGSDELLASYGYVREGAMYRIADHNEKNIAVFCHGGAGAAWIGHLLGLAPALSFVPIVIETSSVTMFEFVKEDNEYIRPELRYLGALHHLYAAGVKEKIKY